LERRGRDLIVKSPEEFLDWLGEPPAGVDFDGQVVSGAGESESPGLVGRVRGLFGGHS